MFWVSIGFCNCNTIVALSGIVWNVFSNVMQIIVEKIFIGIKNSFFPLKSAVIATFRIFQNFLCLFVFSGWVDSVSF